MRPIVRLLLALLAGWGLAAPQLNAQEPGVQDLPTLESLRAQIASLEQLDTEDKETRLAALRAALSSLETARSSRQKAAQFRREADEAPRTIEAIRAELAAPPQRNEPPLDPQTTLRDLELRVQESESTRLAARQLVDELAAESEFRNLRLVAITDELARVRSTIEDREEALRAITDQDPVAVAQRTALQCALEALRAEETMLLAERASYEARRELLPLRRDRAQRQLTRAEQLATLWLDRANAKRQNEAETAARQAAAQRRQTAERFPALRAIAEENERLAELRAGKEGIPARMTRAGAARTTAEQTLQDMSRRFEATRRKVAVGGMSEGMGSLLRREYDWIEAISETESNRKLRADALSEAQLRQISLQEDREAIGDLASYLGSLLNTVEIAESERAAFEALAQDLLRSQRDLQNTLIGELTELISIYLEHERVGKELRALEEEYRAYIEERILWIPSSAGGAIPDPGEVLRGLRWLIHPGFWAEGIGKSLNAAGDKADRVALLALLLALLFGLRGRWRRALESSGEAVRSYRTDRYRHTLLALLPTLGLAAFFPVLIWSLGWWLRSAPGQVSVASAVGAAAQAIFPVYLSLEFVRQLACEKGLGPSHFRWPAPAAARVRRQLNWFSPTAVALLGITLALGQASGSNFEDGLSRLVFLGLCAAVALVLVRLFRPGHSVLEEHFKRSQSMLQHTHRAWYSLLLALPLLLAGLAALGYYYTAQELFDRVSHSFGLLLLLMVINSVLLRALFVARRRMAVDQARQRAQARARANEEEGLARESSAPIDEEEVSIPTVDAQTRQLIRSGVFVSAVLGLYLIWASAFPALRTLDRVQIWPTVEIVAADALSELPELALDAPAAGSTGSTAGSSLGPMDAVRQATQGGTAADAEQTVPDNVTLADLLFAIVLLIATSIVAKNAPGVLEIAILQRTPLDSGSRHALTTLLRYLIILIGISAGLAAVGISWDTIQWLAAALTFGLAFGLQEIFANFVSGLIILIERPIRVGDIITIGDVEGRVTKLRMRATTILDWDRREMLVPNKDFITNHVVNWTLSDPVTRVIIPVGIAYGSDTKRAREVLLRVASENQIVLNDPAPNAIFRGFGDSTLNFELRVFIANRDLWPEVMHTVHHSIDQAFRKEGIEIAFPQRDLHLRSADVWLAATDSPASGEAGSDK